MSERHRYKIHDKLYDLTDYVRIHPGGADVFNDVQPDTNITPMIYTYHKNPKRILAMLPKYEIPLSSDITIRYDTNYTYDTYCELKKLVYDEIHERKIPLYWSNREIAYNAFMLSSYFGTWAYCLYYATNLSNWWMVLLAIMNTGICNLIFHETSHYCGFKNQKYNRLVVNCSYPIITERNWKFIHNYLHHCFTNTNYDGDYCYDKHLINLRHNNSHKYREFNKFQCLYNLALFSLYFFVRGVIISIKRKTKNWVCFPLLIVVFGFYKTVLWYLLSGLIFAFIAQLSHIQHECIQINTENKNDFLYNQVSSSMNYRTDDPVTRFICFGLDIQIEHHLFPNIPHSSLRRIKHIVRHYCDTHDIPYIEKPSVFPSIYSYSTYLYKMGNP